MSNVLDGISSVVSNVFKPNPAKFQPLATVNNVDLKRYAGKWYEVATIPQVYEKDTHCTTAEYELKEDGTISVLNTTRKFGTEEVKTIHGKAFPNEVEPGKLEVQFWWPFRALYWVINLDQQGYTYAVVGHPSRKYLWILSRTPKMDNAIYQQLVDDARAKGFPVEELRVTDQSCNM